MNHHLVGLVVEIIEGGSHFDKDLVAAIPWEGLRRRFVEEVLFEGQVRHKVVDQEQLSVIVAPSWKKTVGIED